MLSKKKLVITTVLAACSLSAVSSVAWAQTASAPATATAAPLKPINLPAVTSHKPLGSSAHNSVVILNDDSVPGGKILLIEVVDGTKRPWDAGVNSYIAGEIKPGDRIEARILMRVIDPINEGKATAVFNLSEPPRTEYGRKSFSITNKWEEYKVEFKATQLHKTYTLTLGVHVGSPKQTVAFGPITVVNLGK